MTPQWNADIIMPEEKGSGTQVIGDNQQVQTTLESGSNITIEDGKISASGTLENVQADWTQSDSEDPSYIQHKPNLSTVATSGEYSDILNRPDLSVYATTSEVADKADKVANAVSGNLAGLDSNGNLTDSGVAAANLVHDASYVHTDNNFSDADATKLSGIAAGAEVNVQANWSQTDNSADDFIKNKPDMSIYAQSANLATVATSGSYTDLVNKPTIPDAQVQSNWNETDTNSKAYIQNKPSIPAAQVQSDWDQTNSSAPDFIKNKPTIPAGVVVDQTYNASSTNAQAGVAVAEAIASVPAQVQADWNETNTSSKSYIQNKPTIPAAVTVDQTYNASSTNAQSGTAVAGAISTKQDTISDLATIRSGAAAGATAVQPSSLATVATTGDYADLQNKPSIPAAQVNSDWNSSSGVSQILNKPTLATVATTGDYDDLLNKPSIPAAQVQSDWSQSDSSAVDFIKNKPTIPPGVTVDQTYNASSTNAQSGTAVAGALASVPSKPLVAGSNITITENTNDFTIAATVPSVDEVPAVTSSDDGKILKASYSGGSGSYAWSAEPTVDEVPAVTSSDDAKVLTATYSGGVGSYAWAAAQGGTTYSAGDGIDITNDTISADVDGTTIGIDSSTKKIKLLSTIPTVDQTYSASSTNAQSGTAVASAIAAVPTKPIVAGSNITITENANNITLASTDTTYTAGNMIAIDSNNNNAIGVSTTAGITDIQQVAALPANPVSTVLYLIPET